MTLAGRLQKASQGLSALQRVQLMLQAAREGRPQDPELRRFSDPNQGRAFNRYVALLHVTTAVLGSRIQVLHMLCGDLEVQAERIHLLEQAAGVLEEEHALKRPRGVRDWRSVKRIDINEFLRSLAQQQQALLLDSVRLRWQELRAVELTWDELSEEFGGEDPARVEDRVRAAEAKGILLKLSAKIGEGKEMPDPEDAQVDELQQALGETSERLETLL